MIKGIIVQKRFHHLALPYTFGIASAFLMLEPAAAHTAFKVCGADKICRVAEAIGEEELARVAGKFTIAGEIVGMNLQVASAWQASNGQRLEASAGVSVTLPGSGRAGASFDAQASVTEAGPGSSPASTGTVQSGAGLQTVRGVTQVIQVAGDDNRVSNGAAIAVTSGQLPAMSGNGQLGATQAAGNGASANVRIVDNGIAVSLALPGAGNVQQQLNLAGSGNIQQQIQLAAHGHQITNHIQLQLQMQPVTAAAYATQGVGAALNMLRGR